MEEQQHITFGNARSQVHRVCPARAASDDNSAQFGGEVACAIRAPAITYDDVESMLSVVAGRAQRPRQVVGLVERRDDDGDGHGVL